MSLFPRSMLTIGHLPPLCFSNTSWSSLNVMLRLDVRNLALYLQPPRRCMLVRSWLHLVHNIGPCELCFFLHLYTCDPHATSYASRQDQYGDCEYACILKYVPVSLASCRSLPKTPLVAAVLLVSLSSFLMHALRLVSFLMCSALLGGLCLISVYVRRPSIGGSASSNVMSGVFLPSTTALAALSAVSLYSTSVCDLTSPMCVFSCLESLAFSSWFVSCRRSLWRCWL